MENDKGRLFREASLFCSGILHISRILSAGQGLHLSGRDSHLSGAIVAERLERPTRADWAGHRTEGRILLPHCLALHPVRFTQPSRSPGTLVGSYPTVSPLT